MSAHQLLYPLVQLLPVSQSYIFYDYWYRLWTENALLKINIIFYLLAIHKGQNTKVPGIVSF